MRRILAALMLLSGCSVEVPNEPTVATGSVHPSKQLGIPECPTLPRELPITITGRWGIDALLCEAISNSSREKLFQVYVGAHPDTSDRYGTVKLPMQEVGAWFGSMDQIVRLSGHANGRHSFQRATAKRPS